MSEINLVRKSSNFISFLYDKAKAHFDTDELEWIGHCDDFMLIELENIYKTIENTASLIMADKEQGSFDGPENAVILLFSIKHQLETLTECLYITKNARDRVNNREFYKKMDEAEARTDAKARSASLTTDKIKPA